WDHHFLAAASGSIEGLLDHYYEGNRPNGIYIPRFRNLGDDASRRDYVRGFGYQGGASRQGWGRGAGGRGFGVELKRQLHDPGTWSMGMTGFGECLPREDNYAELADKTDDVGIPLLTIHRSGGDIERAGRDGIAAQDAVRESVGHLQGPHRARLRLRRGGAEAGQSVAAREPLHNPVRGAGGRG